MISLDRLSRYAQLFCYAMLFQSEKRVDSYAQIPGFADAPTDIAGDLSNEPRFSGCHITEIWQFA